eukprot:9206970-Alexandrium_andersonii.AAC.1
MPVEPLRPLGPRARLPIGSSARRPSDHFAAARIHAARAAIATTNGSVVRRPWPCTSAFLRLALRRVRVGRPLMCRTKC